MKESTLRGLNAKNFYEQQITKLEEKVKSLKLIAKRWVLIRLITFLVIPLTVYFFYHIGTFIILIVLIEVLTFLFVVRKSIENKELLQFNKNLLWINASELKALNGDFSTFPSGKQFVDTNHAFSFDFDVFGKNGFFQFFNRTVSKEAEQYLAEQLLNGVDNEKINHAAIEELLLHVSWSQRFRAKGMESGKTKSQVSTLLYKWAEASLFVKNWLIWAQYLFPIIALGASILYYFDFISGLFAGILIIIALSPTLHVLKKSNLIHKNIVQQSFRVNAMQEQLHILQEVSFNSPKLIDFQKKLFQEKINALEAITRLNKLIKQFEYRNNILVAVILNLYLSWDIRLILKLNKWKDENSSFIKDWEYILMEMESLISGMNFRFNRINDTIYPTLTQPNDAMIAITKLGHPLIPLDKIVYNDYHLSKTNHFSIITGPNMAGKSTFLRSIGINLMLAKAGFPVIASSFVFPRLNLYSSMRTSDDLSNESSYFHAELIRLRFIMDAIEKGENVFIVLDEILKGTNSKDKEEGSAKFLSKLVKLGARGIIATHDLKLTELAEKNDSLVNLYFDTTIEGDDIDFDYTIRPGVAKNMNASFLLKKMGLSE